MTHILLAAAFALSAMNGCKPAPPTPPAAIERYATDIAVQSTILNRTVLYSVYLPDDYATNKTKRYPVVYLLHGLGDDHKAWNDKWLHITTLINSLEKQGVIEPMIYVMPQGWRSYYVNRFDGGFDWQRMFTAEFVPRIDQIYRTLADREHRAIVGYSMGGFGALVVAAKNSEMFSVSIPLSISMRTDEQYMTESANGWNGQWGAIFGGSGLSGAARLTDYYKQMCPLHYSAADFGAVNYYIDCGDDEEQLLVSNDLLHRQMRSMNVRHEYRVRNGAHTSDYWFNAMREGFLYINTLFNGDSWRAEASITVSDNYAATTETLSDARIYYSAGYSTSVASRVIYFVHPAGFTEKERNQLACALGLAQSNKSVIFAATATADIANFAASFETGRNISKRIGAAYGAGGATLYNYADNLSSLYLFDATTGSGDPNSETYYFIAITDNGTNYNAAGELYVKCHAQDKKHDYRVYNGIDSFNSLLYMLSMSELISNN